MATEQDKPTPGIMSAARLARIHEDADDCREALADDQIRNHTGDEAITDALHRLIAEHVPALLARLDALHAGPEDGGEAMGRLLAGIMADHIGADGDPLGYNAGALTLYRRGRAAAREEAVEDRVAAREKGRAAGRAEGEAAVYVCPCCYHQRGDEVPADVRSTREQMAAEIVSLAADRDKWRDMAERALGGGRRAMDDRDAEIARLTTALDAERTLSAELRAIEEEAGASADRWRAASERHASDAERLTAELARLSAENLTRIDAARFNAESAEKIERLHAAEVAAARIEGARVERERLIAHYEGLGRTGIVSELRKLDLGARGAGGAG